MRLSAIQQALSGKPVLMDPTALSAILGAQDHELRPRDGASVAQRAGSVAVIKAHGVLMDSPGVWDSLFEGAIGYQDIVDAVEAAALDDSVGAILLDINSPGGEAAGMYPAMDAIRAAAQIKPIHGWSGGRVCSAGYGMLAACTTARISEGTIAGSVGSYIEHTDVSKALAAAGITKTMLGSGTQKTAGNPYEPLSESARADFQAKAVQYRDLFVDKVAVMRGMDAGALRAHESRTYIGQAAVDAGLVDGIRTKAQLLAELSGDTLNGSEEETMAGTPGASAPKVAAQAATPDTMEAVLAAFPQAANALRAAGATAERERIASLHALAKAGFEAELAEAISKGMSAEAYSLAVLKAEKADPSRAMLAQLRKDGDLGVSGSVTETLTGDPLPPAGKSAGPKAKAEALFAKPEMQAKYDGNFGIFLYSEDAEKALSRDELMNARQALNQKGA